MSHKPTLIRNIKSSFQKQENHVYTCMSAYDKYVTEKNLEIEMRRFFTMVDIPYIY